MLKIEQNYPHRTRFQTSTALSAVDVIAENNKKTALYGMLGAALGGAALAAATTSGMGRDRGKVVLASAAVPAIVALLAMNFVD